MESVRRSQRAKSPDNSLPAKGSRSGVASEPVLGADWQLFLDGLLDGVLVADADGRCVFGNVSAKGLLELTALEISGRQLNDFAVQEDGQPVRPQNQSENARREPMIGCFTRGDGSRFDGEYFAQPLPAECGVGIIITFRAQAHGDERRKIARGFVSGIAHDLNNLLSPVIMATEVLRASPSPETTDLALGIIEQAAKRGVELVNRVVNSTREIPGENEAPHAQEALRADATVGSKGETRNVPVTDESSKAVKKGQHR